MKIAFILDDFPAVTQTFILSQINGMIDYDFEVDLYALRQSQYVKDHFELSRNNLLDRVVYLPASPRNRVVRFIQGVFLSLTHRGWLSPAMLIRSLNFRKYRPAMRHLFRLLPFFKSGSRQYDVIHCQFGTVAPLAMQLIQLGALKGKLVTSIRGHDITQSEKVIRGVYKDLYKFGDAFLPVSESLKNMLLADGCAEDKITVLHSGIDCEKFEYKERTRYDNEPVRLITTARLVEMKGLRYAIEAVSLLISRGVNITYDIIGDGLLRDELEEQIKALGVGDKITLCGWLDHEEVKARLADAHILIAPSITADNGEKEGIPNAVKEAMAQGLPVVATWHSGIPELVEHGVSGLLSEERDVKSLAENIEYLLNNTQDWAEMGRKGRQHVLDEFDITKMNVKLVEIYQSLLK